MTRSLKAILAAGAVALAVTPTLAEEVETTGTVTYKTVSSTDLGNGLARVTTSGKLMAASAEDPANGATSTCTGLYKDGNGVAGSCDHVDADGDAYVSTWVGFGDNTGSSWEVLMGTGKFANMVGSGTTENEAGEGSTKVTWEGIIDMDPPVEELDEEDMGEDDMDADDGESEDGESEDDEPAGK